MFPNVLVFFFDRLVNVSEMDGFVEAFRFLVSNYSVGDITHPQSSVEVEYKDRMIGQILSMLAKNVSISPEHRTSNGQMGVENTDCSLIENQLKIDEAAGAANESKEVKEEQLPPKFKYPCIMAMMGSGGGILKVGKAFVVIFPNISEKKGYCCINIQQESSAVVDPVPVVD